MPLPDRDAFLQETRIGILTTIAADNAPISVPVWYEWDGQRARVFSSVTSAKIGRIERTGWASLLVTNVAGEPEFWVAMDGEVEVRPEGAIELAERLAERYWDLTETERAAAVRGWRKNAGSLVMLELTPARFRTYGA
jgi:PPOX class probable F420-dependent enzyme